MGGGEISNLSDNSKFLFKNIHGFPWWSNNWCLPTNAGDMGLILGPGKPHTPQGN